MTTEQVTEPTQEQIAADSNAGFEKGFGTMRGSPPVETKPEKVEAKVEEPKQEVVTETKVEEDPWAGVPPAVKAELESISGKLKSVSDIEHRVKSYEGRLGAINKSIEGLAAAKAAAATVSDAPSAAQIETSAKSAEKWKQLKEDFPDWVEAMDSRLAEVQAAIPKAAPAVNVDEIRASLRGEIEAQFAPLLKETALAARQAAAVDRKHENWEETINTPEFGAWLPTQAPEIRALADSPKAADAIALLDAYVESRKKAEVAAKAKAANDQRLKSAMTPKGVPGAAAETLNDTDAFERGFKKGSSS